MNLSRSFWFFLIAGIGLRCIALNQPLIDHGLLRQTQTAAVTQSLIEQPGFPISSRIPWIQDAEAKFVLELPVYNYLVIPVFKLLGNLDLSGKLVSVILWGASFWLLQFIWKRCLNPRQTFWANVIFVVSPLGVFYSQAFMPETLVQTLAFGFVLSMLRYDESPDLMRWIVCAAIGLFCLLVKTPATAHLYFLLAALLFRREGWRCMVRPRHWVAAIFTIFVLKAWSHYVDQINAPALPEWTSARTLRLFLGSFESRFQLKPWAMITIYLGTLVVPGFVAIAALNGIRVIAKVPNRILILWLVSLLLFYVVWLGNTAATQSYYNIVALAPLCALVGIGISQVLDRPVLAVRPKASPIAALALILICTTPSTIYLFKQDTRAFAAAEWAAERTAPQDVVIFVPNHRWEMVDYPYNAVFSHYSHRRSVVWAGHTSTTEKTTGLRLARYAIVTQPKPPGQMMAAVNRFRGVSARKPQSTEPLEQVGFRLLEKNDDFLVYRKE